MDYGARRYRIVKTTLPLNFFRIILSTRKNKQTDSPDLRAALARAQKQTGRRLKKRGRRTREADRRPEKIGLIQKEAAEDLYRRDGKPFLKKAGIKVDKLIADAKEDDSPRIRHNGFWRRGGDH